METAHAINHNKRWWKGWVINFESEIGVYVLYSCITQRTADSSQQEDLYQTTEYHHSDTIRQSLIAKRVMCDC